MNSVKGPARITASEPGLATLSLTGRSHFRILWPMPAIKVSTDMASLYAEKYAQKPTTIHQQTGSPSNRLFEQIDQLLILVPQHTNEATWRKLPQGNKLKALVRRRGDDSVPALVSRLNNRKQTGVLLAKVPDSRRF